MGDNYGPMIVVRNDGPTSLDGVTVAIPGTLTTAFLALRLYKPDVKYVAMPFDEILEAVRDGKVEAGLLIHEGQLTYEQEGLRKLVDFGEWWAERTGGLPLPLGGNVIRRDLGPELIARLSTLLHDSIAYGLNHRADAVTHAMKYGRGLDRSSTDTFVGMYVNDLTLDYGERGRRRCCGSHRGGGEEAHPASRRRLAPGAAALRGRNHVRSACRDARDGVQLRDAVGQRGRPRLQSTTTISWICRLHGGDPGPAFAFGDSPVHPLPHHDATITPDCG
jgi:1,4-dihydroxy-6-naphthoate synthase